MTFLRVILSFLVIVFLAIFGFFALLFKIISTLFGSTPKAPPPPRGTKSANAEPKPSAPTGKAANSEVIEVEVISVRKED